MLILSVLELYSKHVRSHVGTFRNMLEFLILFKVAGYGAAKLNVASSTSHSRSTWSQDDTT
eukprot:11493196-Karenia_brevis.AAC.1